MDTVSNISDLEKALRYLIWSNNLSPDDIDYKEFFELCLQIVKDEELAKKYAKFHDKVMEFILK